MKHSIFKLQLIFFCFLPIVCACTKNKTNPYEHISTKTISTEVFSQVLLKDLEDGNLLIVGVKRQMDESELHSILYNYSDNEIIKTTSVNFQERLWLNDILVGLNSYIILTPHKLIKISKSLEFLNEKPLANGLKEFGSSVVGDRKNFLISGLVNRIDTLGTWKPFSNYVLLEISENLDQTIIQEYDFLEHANLLNNEYEYHYYSGVLLSKTLNLHLTNEYLVLWDIGNSFGEPHNKIYLTKITLSGEMVWSKEVSIGKGATDLAFVQKNIFVITNDSYSPTGSISNRIVILDENNQIIFKETYSGDFFYDIIEYNYNVVVVRKGELFFYDDSGQIIEKINTGELKPISNVVIKPDIGLFFVYNFEGFVTKLVKIKLGT